MADSIYNLQLTAEVIDDILVWLNDNYDIVIKQTDLAGATGQSTTITMTQKAITDALDGKADVFWATYGSTTAGNIYTAFSAGKLVLLKYNGLLFVCFQSSASSYFVSPGSNGTIHYILCDSSSSWSSGDTACETTSNKVTSLSGSSTDTEYPSAKAVYDELAGKQNVTKVEDTFGYSFLVIPISSTTIGAIRVDMQWDGNYAGSILLSGLGAGESVEGTYYGDDVTSGSYAYTSIGYYTDTNDDPYIIIANENAGNSKYYSIYALDGSTVSASLVDDISDYTLVTEATITDISSDLADKQDKDDDAVEGNLAEFDANGNTIDAGIAADDIAEKEGLYEGLAAGAITKVMAGQEFLARATAGGAAIVDGVQQLKAIYGNSRQFNQHIVDGSISGSATHTNSNTYFIAQLGTNSYSFYGHKVYVRGKVTMTIAPARLTIQVDNTSITYFDDISANTAKDIACIGSVTSSAWYGLRLYASGLTAEDGCVMTWDDINVYDLTAMGIDSLTTISEVEAWLAGHIGSNDYYASNAGEILNNKTTALQTTGFNQWDEEWELGVISSVDGSNVASASYYRSKNYIPVIPNTIYYFKKPAAAPQRQAYYDANKAFISLVDLFASNGTGGTFTTPSNAAYMRFYVAGSTYNNDICINISSSRNGEYEAYVEPSTLTLDLTSITSGGVQICADGLMSAGSVRDKLVVDADGYARTLIKYTGVADLGDLSWRLPSTAFVSESLTDVALETNCPLLCANYAITDVTSTSAQPDKSIIAVMHAMTTGVLGIKIKDSSYTTAAAFKTAMAGVKLIYKLATPVTYTLDTPIYCGFTAYNGGTEVQVPANGSTPTTAAFYADVIYRVAASSVITEGSLTNLLNALKSAGKITSYTLNFDEESGNYEFTIS